MASPATWPLVPLGRLVTDGQISYGIVQPGPDDSEGVPIIRVRDIRGGVIDTTNPLRVSPEVSARHRRTVLKGGEVVLSLVGTVGEAAIVGSALAGWNCARAVAVLRPHDVSNRWLTLALRGHDVQSQITAVLNTTVQSTLNLSDLKRVLVPVPPSNTQDAITEVLGALDDKIAANTSLAATVNALSRELFVAAAGQCKETVPLADLASSIRDVVQPGGATGAYVGLEHVPRRRMWLGEIGDAGTVTSAKSRFRRGDVLFGKLRPYFHKVVSAPVDGVSSTDILVVRAHEHVLKGFVLAAVTSDALVERAVAASEGTRMPRASWKDLASWPVPWPGRDAALELSCRVAVLRDAVEARLRENVTLAATRDMLLPQLMSGKLRVREAAEMAGL